LHFAAGNAPANFFNRAGKNRRTAVSLVIAVHAGYNRIAQAHAGDGLPYADWFFLIRRTDRPARGNCTEAASARADVAEDHEGRSAVLPAFAHVGAARGFTDRVQFERAHDPLQVLIARTTQEFHPQPAGPRMGVGRRRRRRVRDDVERGGHALCWNTYVKGFGGDFTNRGNRPETDRLQTLWRFLSIRNAEHSEPVSATQTDSRASLL